MAKKQYCDPSRELRIRSVNGDLLKKIKNIAAHQGVPVTQFLAPIINRVADAYPDHMKKPERLCEPCSELTITGINSRAKESLQNVAEYYGIHLSDLIKVILEGIKDEFPQHMQQEMEL
jgi:hypothetical protein